MLVVTASIDCTHSSADTDTTDPTMRIAGSMNKNCFFIRNNKKINESEFYEFD
jgi:hypothetical protein